MYDEEDDLEQGTPAPVNTAKPKTDIKVKRVKEEKKDPDQKSPGIERIFPKIGEKMEDFDRRSGDLKITSIQMPEIEDITPGQTVTFKVTAVLKHSEYEQDSEYKDGFGRVATSDPYLCGRFEIVSVESTSDPDTPEDES